MEEMFFGLVLLGLVAVFVIGCVTVLVWLVRLFSGKPAAQPQPIKLEFTAPARVCAGCGAELTVEDLFCMVCGAAQITNNEAELRSAKRVLLRLFNAKRIDEASFQQVWQALEAGEAKPPQRVTAAIAKPPSITPPAPATAEPLPMQHAVPPEPLPSTPPPEPRRSFTEMLATFMEESSIRWGELIGGLLIIGSSLALVVSLWSEIAERPVLKFGVFMTLVAGLFGLGFYSAHRWRLPTTSRGVLLTATLLTPLYFLAVVAFGRTTAASAGIVLAEAGSWLVLAVLVWLAARVVALDQQRWLTVGTMGASLALLLGKHFAPAELNWRSWLLLGALPVLGCVASVGAAVRGARRVEAIKEHAVYGLFTVLGVNVFAALLPLGLLQVRAGHWAHALRENAPLLALLGVPALAVGWLLWRRLDKQALAGERTVAASVGLCGALLLVGSALLAFPLVDSLVVIALLNAAVFGWAAWRYELRAARWLAWAQAVWAYLLFGQLALGRLTFGLEDARQVLAAAFSYSSAVLLIAVFAALTVTAEWLRSNEFLRSVTGRINSPLQGLAREYEVASWLAGGFSLLLASLHGLAVAGDPHQLAWVYAAYALAAFVLGWRHNDVRGSWLGWLLLLGVSAQTVVFKIGWPQGWLHAWIVHWLVLATAGALVALLTVWGGEKARGLLAKPALQTAWGYAAWASVAMLARNTGLDGWHVAPLALTVLACVVYARRGASEVAAWAGGLLFNATVTVGYVVWVKQDGTLIRSHELARVAQWNLLAGAVYALGWLRATRQAEVDWLRWQVRVVTGAALGVLGLAALRLTADPWLTSEFARTFGDGLGWLALGGVAAGLVYGKRALPCVRNVALALLAVGALLACTLHRFEYENWLSYHTLLATAVVVAWAMLWLLLVGQAGSLSHPTNRVGAWLNALLTQTKATADSATGWALGLSVVAVLLSLRGFDAPGGPWRGVIAVSAIAALMVGLAVARRNGAYVYAAGALVCTALTLWIFGYSKGGGTLLDVALLNVTALAGVGLLSLWLELKVLRATPVKTGVPAFHQFTAALLLALTCLQVGGGLWLDFVGAAPLPVKGWIGGLALGAVLLLCLGCVWDGLFVYRFVALFVAGLALAGALVDRRNLPAQALLVAAAVVLTGYALAAALVWLRREQFAARLQAWRVPALEAAVNAAAPWLVYAEAGLAIVAIGNAVAASLAVESWPQRLLATSAALVAPLAVGWLARMGEVANPLPANRLSAALPPDVRKVSDLPAETSSIHTGLRPAGGVAPQKPAQPPEGRRPSAHPASEPQSSSFAAGPRLRWQTLALGLEFAALTAWLWAALNLRGAEHAANRLVALLALALTASLSFFGARAAEVIEWPRVLGAWEAAARRVLFGAGLVGLGLLGVALLIEWTQLSSLGGVQLGWWAKATLTVGLLALCMLSVAFALWRGRDPFELAAEQRGRYVYAAEVCAVLLLVHVRMIAPWLFTGVFKQYWPLLVLALAFVGVGVSEQLRRRGRVVLAEPLARTGVFLPLLPSLGFWLPSDLFASRVDYAGLLLAVGLFYGLLSVMRQSFGFGLLAALAGNGGWWHWLHRTEDFGFLVHPQVWLIPAALSVMLAAHLNRAQLSREQMTSIRYAALITIYVSSTADIFINGVADSPWLPLVLAVLSVAGVLLGLLLQVRAYLFLGTAFLLLAVITMVWHAALSLGWGWLWYVSGIAFGILILSLFALFERRRAEMLGLVERLKTWQA